MRAARTPGKCAARYLKGDVFTGTFENNLKTGLGRITYDPQRSVMLSSGQSWRAIGPSCLNKLHPSTTEKRWDTGRVFQLQFANRGLYWLPRFFSAPSKAWLPLHGQFYDRLSDLLGTRRGATTTGTSKRASAMVRLSNRGLSQGAKRRFGISVVVFCLQKPTFSGSLN